MRLELTADEESYLAELRKWRETGEKTQFYACQALLLIGGAVLVVVLLYTVQQLAAVQHLDDRSVLWVTLPGFLLGTLFLTLHVFTERRFQERRLTASVIAKLLSGDDGSNRPTRWKRVETILRRP